MSEQGKMIRLPGIGTLFHQSYGRNKGGQLLYSSTWYLRFNHLGRKHLVPLRTAKYILAVKRAKESVAKIVRGEPVGSDANRVRFEDMAEMIKSDYDLNNRRSKDRLEDAINHLAGSFNRYRAVDITGARINAYAESRHKDEGAALGTVHNELAALRRMFTLAIRAGTLFQRPAFPTISLNNARKGFFEEREFQAVLEQLPELDRPVVEFAYFTGWRKSEILNLQWQQIDFRAGVMRLEVGTTKNDEGRTFPFAVLPELKTLLEKQRAYTNEVETATGKKVVWVFHRNGERIKSLKKAWRKAVEAAGVPHRIIHDFRRTAVRNLERAGVSRSVAMKLTGHKTEAVYRRYAIVCESDLSEGVIKLATLHREQPPPEPETAEEKVAVGGGKVVTFPARR